MRKKGFAGGAMSTRNGHPKNGCRKMTCDCDIEWDFGKKIQIGDVMVKKTS